MSWRYCARDCAEVAGPAAQALAGGADVDGKRVWAPPPLAIAHQLLKAWAEGG
jgi:hypothetical protein